MLLLSKAFVKHFGNFSDRSLKFYQNLVLYRFKICRSNNGSLPTGLYGYLVYKVRRVRGSNNFISSDTKVVIRFRRRQYDQVIAEKTIGRDDKVPVFVPTDCQSGFLQSLDL